MTRFKALLEGYAAGSLTEEELEELLNLLKQNEIPLAQHIDEDLKSNAYAGFTTGAQRIELLERIRQKIKQKETRIIRLRWTRIAVAAVLMLTTGLGAYFAFWAPIQKPGVANRTEPLLKNDVAPGRENAILTLADGRQVVLDQASGTITTENGIQIINVNGLLAYQGKNPANEELYNTITTARGNQYRLQLEDGTKVWLNAASSLRYPVTFRSNDRTVELTGEGYFEVAKDKARPFHVKTGETEVQVLGTHFNINAYQDEERLKATLFEGSVKVMHAKQEQLLKPGQQAQVIPGGNIVVKNAVDLEGVIAWKNGLFLFDNIDLPAIMRQISRWYDVDVVYEGKIPDKRFGGGISKNLPLSKVLELLTANGLQFKLKGKVLTVIP